MSRFLWVAAAVALAGSATEAAELEPHYGAPGAWVKPAVLPAAPAMPEGAPAQALLEDIQTYYGTDGDQRYVEFAGKVLTPDGLSTLGGISSIEWNPDIESVTIHKLQIIRGGVVIDRLPIDKFITLRRETNLEKLILDGRLTAAVQITDLQVGDIVDFAFTVTRRDPVMQGHSESEVRLIRGFDPARIRFRGVWPTGKALRWRATGGLTGAKASAAPDGSEVAIDLLAPKTTPPPDNAPPRFQDAGRLEFSQFNDWSEVSGLLEPLFRKATTLAPASPLRAEAAKIRAQTSDPELQAGLALRLVQDQVRYLFVGLDNGGYDPAPADLTWSRRFGDCKGKTVLLLALLAELGIKAEPVMVNFQGGDGLDQHLPRLGVFDHILVRAEIRGHAFWLDGTGAADRDVRQLSRPNYGWGLPVRARGGALERMQGEPLIVPQAETVMTIDASAGVDASHPVRVETILHGLSAVGFGRKVGAMSRDDAQHLFLEGWTKAYSWVDIQSVDWTSDAAAGEFRFSMQGVGKPGDWPTDTNSGARAFEVDGSGFGKLNLLGRPPSQDATAPFAVAFPAYERSVTVLKLPDRGAGFTILGDNVATALNGLAYRRDAHIENGAAVMIRSTRALVSETTAAQVKIDNQKLKAFDPGPVWVRAGVPDAKTPTDPEGLVTLGFSLVADGDLDRASALFDQALALKPDYIPAIVGRAEVFVARENYDMALAEFDRAIRLSPQPNVQLELGRGEVLAAAGRYDQAVAAYSRALARGPDAGLLRARAQAYASQGQLDPALADAEQAVKLAPDDATAFNLRAALHLARRETPLALEDFDHALRLEPDDMDNLLGRGSAYQAMGQYDRAIADFDEARRVDPAAVQPWRARSVADLSAGRFAIAVKDLDSALGLTPDSAPLLNARCWARAVWGQELDAALADCTAALKLTPKDAAILDSRGLIRLRQGQLDAAIADYDTALAAQPRLATSLYGRGLAKLRKGDAAGGKADLDAAKAADPGVAGDFTGWGLKP